METIDGAPATDGMIQEWADEAGHEYDADVLEKRGRRSIGDDTIRIAPVRMDDSLVATVGQRAEKDGTSRPEIIRSAVRAFVV